MKTKIVEKIYKENKNDEEMKKIVDNCMKKYMALKAK